MPVGSSVWLCSRTWASWSVIQVSRKTPVSFAPSMLMSAMAVTSCFAYPIVSCVSQSAASGWRSRSAVRSRIRS